MRTFQGGIDNTQECVTSSEISGILTPNILILIPATVLEILG